MNGDVVVYSEIERAAAERASERHSVAVACELPCASCRRTTWHYLVARIWTQQVYRCAGCGRETVYRIAGQ